MKCPQHPNYKGVKYPKRNCRYCEAVYKSNQSANPYKKYNSLSTPEFKCGLCHLLAEISTLMIYGPQPKFFWRKGAKAKKQAYNHYVKVINATQTMCKKNKDFEKNARNIFYLIFEQYNKSIVANRNRDSDEIAEKQIDNIKNKKENSSNTIHDVVDDTQNFLLDMLGGDNGKKEN